MLEESSAREELFKAVQKLVKSFKVYVVILFGSRARGDYKPWSDYDLLIIGDFQEKYLDRIAKILEVLSDVKILIEPHPYTLSEALEMLTKGNPTIIDALSEGVILYYTKEFETLSETYKELLKKGLKRSNVSIILPSDT